MAETETQMMVPQQAVTVDELLAQQAPGKESPEAASALAAQLEGMSNEDLLQLLEAATKEDPEANSLAIEKATKVLSARGAGDAAKDKLKEVRSEDWRNLLGDFVGGELHSIISDNTDVADLQSYGNKALDGALGALVGLIDKIGLDGDGSAALEKFGAALAAEAVKMGDEWLATESGQKLLRSVSGWVDDHPAYILVGVILAAAGAIAADMPIPELKTKLNITKGLTAEVQAKLGSLRHIALEAAKLDLQYVKGSFTAKAGVEKSEKGVGGNLSLQVGDEKNHVETHGSIDPEGKLLVGLDAAITSGMFAGSLKGDHEVGTNKFNGKAKVKIGEGTDFFEIGSGLERDAAGNLKLDLGADFMTRFGNDQNNLSLNGGAGLDNQGDLTKRYGLGFRQQLDPNSFFHGNVQGNGNEFSSTIGTTRQFGDFTSTQQTVSKDNDITNQTLLGYHAGGLDLSLDARDKGGNGSIDSVAAELGFTVPQLVALVVKYGRDADGKETGSITAKHDGENFDAEVGVSHDGSNTHGNLNASYKKDNWLAEVTAGANLTSGDLEKLSVKFGFRDPNEFRAFSVELSHTVTDGVSQTQLAAMFEAKLGAFMIRGTADATLSEQGNKFGGSIYGAKHLGGDWTGIAGVSATHDNLTGQSNFIPQVGVQYKNIPITVGWDFKNEGVVVGITIPFGR